MQYFCIKTFRSATIFSKSQNRHISLSLARFILETDDPSRRIICLTDHPTKYKHKTNLPDELCKYPGRELCLADVSVSLYYDLIVRLVQHLYTPYL